MWTTAQPLLPLIQYPCRYATTHFQSGALVPIDVRAVFLLHRAGEPDLEVTTSWAKPRPIAYNKLLRVATTVPPGVPPGLEGKTVPEVANLSVAVASQYIGTDMKHSDLTVGSPSAQSKSDIINRLDECTAFFAFTHGANTGFYDSFSLSDPASFLDWNDVWSATARPATIPQPNLAVLYSCDTLGGIGSIIAGLSFRVTISAGQPLLEDKVYLGFPEPVMTLIDDGSVEVVYFWQLPITLDKHAQLLLTQLALGYRVHEALTKANKTYPPQTLNLDGNWYRTDMQLRGDPMMTLKSVYLSIAEFDAATVEERFRWYYLQ